MFGIERGALKGKRVFKNYPSALAASDSVSSAICARVDAKKTICLGKWAEIKSELDSAFDDYFVFPMGAVPKPHQPDVMRGGGMSFARSMAGRRCWRTMTGSAAVR